MPFDPDLLKKRKELLAADVELYPYSWDRTHTLLEIRENQQEFHENNTFP